MAARTAVVAGTATAVSGGVRRHQENKYQQQEQQQAWEQQQQDAAQQAQMQQYAQQAAAAQAAQAPAGGGTDMASKIKQLADLHDAGALNDDEFAAAKAKLLS
jgi:hypothetical protein